MKLPKSSLQYFAFHFGFLRISNSSTNVYTITEKSFKFFLVSNRVYKQLLNPNSLLHVERNGSFSLSSHWKLTTIVSPNLMYLSILTLLQPLDFNSKIILLTSDYYVRVKSIWKKLVPAFKVISSKNLF